MMKVLLALLIAIVITGLIGFSCRRGENLSRQNAEILSDSLKTLAPDWAKTATIYEVNIRQYTPEGTLKAFEKHLPRLAEMGVDILWLMPIFPISHEKRKGALGSYYAVSDFRIVNPEFGSMKDFQELVVMAHGLGMKIILDWVPNHTGWDHTWIKAHPDFYTQDAEGNIIDPIDPETGKSWGWTDVADLNFANKEMWQAQLGDMIFWIKNADIDGFRMDVAHNVPNEFWDFVCPKLREQKEVFMLAEAEVPHHRNSGDFAASYGWSLHHILNKIAKGEVKPTAIDNWLTEDRKNFNRGYHMHFITNHDENSWNGTEYERMKEAVDAMAVLTFTFDGIPLIYSGQESAFNRRLQFFEKDSIDWADFSKKDFYKTLSELKHQNQALWNGEFGGQPQKIRTGQEDAVYAFWREKNGDKVIVVLNFSAKDQEIKIKESNLMGTYQSVFGNGTMVISDDATIKLKPWEYLVLSNK